MSKHFTIEPEELARLRNYLRENNYTVGDTCARGTELFSDIQLRTWAELFIPREQLLTIIGRP